MLRGRLGWLVAGSLLACGGGSGDPGGTAPDTQPPTVSITGPAAGATVAGTIEVRAAAQDNDAVAGVEFRLDGALLAPEVTSAPYRVEWATGGAANGVHAITATARDASGNTAAAEPVSVTVSNLPPVPPGSIVVTTTTTGTGTDADGYVVTAGGVQLPIAANGTVTLLPVPAGTHTVFLSGVSPFCVVV